jgi:hypothetical protein
MKTKKANNRGEVFTLVTTYLLHSMNLPLQTLINTGVLVMSTIEWE